MRFLGAIQLVIMNIKYKIWNIIELSKICKNISLSVSVVWPTRVTLYSCTHSLLTANGLKSTRTVVYVHMDAYSNEKKQWPYDGIKKQYKKR